MSEILFSELIEEIEAGASEKELRSLSAAMARFALAYRITSSNKGREELARLAGLSVLQVKEAEWGLDCLGPDEICALERVLELEK